MALFGKKEEETQEVPIPPAMGGEMPPASTDIPKNQVLQLRNQGMNNNQIIQELQNKGFNSQQIFDAMSAADASGYADPAIAQPEMGPPAMGQGQMPPAMGVPEQMPAISSQPESRERIEEMAEAIIDEKWEELVKSINKIIEWKEKVEGDITKIQQEAKDLKENYNQLQSSIIGKINEYDRNIINVGTEVKAMEKVFKDILPKFTENINELGRIVKTKKTNSKK